MIALALLLAACGAPGRPVNAPVPAPGPDRPEPARPAVSQVRRVDRFPFPPQATDVRTSPDARHVSYRLQSTDRRENFVVADGVVQGPWRAPPDPIVWSETSGRLAYYATRSADGSLVLVVDGRESEPDERLDRSRHPRGYSRAGPIAWSPDGRHLATGVSRSDARGFRTDILVDGEERARFDFRDAGLLWSPSGQLAAYGRRGTSSFAWVEGWEKVCTSIDFESLRWVDGALELAGVCEGRRALFRGRSAPREIAAGLASPAASKDDRLAYVLVAARQHQLVLDDRIRATHDTIADLAFLPDGSSVVFAAVDLRRHRVVLLDGWESSPTEEVLAHSLTVRPDGGCVAWSEAELGARFVVTRGVAGHPEACEDETRGPYSAVSSPVWNDDGGISFSSSVGSEALLHVGDVDIALGALGEGLLRIAREPDGRLAHLAAIDGSLWRVLRARGDTTAVATLVRDAAPSSADADGATVTAIAEIPDDAEHVAVENRTQRVAWVAPTQLGGGPPAAFIGGEHCGLVAPFGAPTWNEDGHVFWARAIGGNEAQVVVDTSMVTRLVSGSRLVPARRGTAFTSVFWRGMSHHVRRATGQSFSVGQSPPGALFPGPDGRHVLATDESSYPPRVLLDGRVVARGMLQGVARWSEDGEHVLFVAAQDASRRLYRDARLVGRAESFQPIGFDAAGRAAWVETDASGTRLVLGDRRAPVRGVAADRTVWDPRGEHAGIVALEEDGEMTVLRDLVPVRSDLRGVRDLAWSADGTRLAWVAGSGGERAVHVDGEVVARTTDVVPGSVRFAPDGRLSWAALDRAPGSEPSVTLRIGDESWGPYDEIAPPGAVFSPAGASAWVARSGASWTLFAGGRVVTTLDDVLPGARATWLEDGALGLLGVRVMGEGLARNRTAVRVRWLP